jgi:hypothetical protein
VVQLNAIPLSSRCVIGSALVVNKKEPERLRRGVGAEREFPLPAGEGSEEGATLLPRKFLFFYI